MGKSMLIPLPSLQVHHHAKTSITRISNLEDSDRSPPRILSSSFPDPASLLRKSSEFPRREERAKLELRRVGEDGEVGDEKEDCDGIASVLVKAITSMTSHVTTCRYASFAMAAVQFTKQARLSNKMLNKMSEPAL